MTVTLLCSGSKETIWILASAYRSSTARVCRSRTTMDVDALAIDPRGPVLESARAVAREQGLRADWLNDQIRFVPILPPRQDPRAEVLFDSESLVVTGASPAHILAMKVRAARPLGKAGYER